MVGFIVLLILDMDKPSIIWIFSYLLQHIFYSQLIKRFTQRRMDALIEAVVGIVELRVSTGITTLLQMETVHTV